MSLLDALRVLPGVRSLPDPFALAAAVTERLDPTRYRGRRVWRGKGGRVHIGVHGVTHERGTDLARVVEDALRRHPKVGWAAVNAALGVVVVGTAGDVDIDELVNLVEAVEDAHAPKDGRRQPRPDPTGDQAAARAITAIVADVAGLTVGGAARLLKLSPLPAEVASVMTFLEFQPRLRAVVERALGRQRADVVLSLAYAVTQALAQRSSGLVLDCGQRAVQLAEARARMAAWARQEAQLCGRPDAAAAEAVTPERPAPLPSGPIEKYVERAWVATLGTYVGALAVSRDSRRADALALSTIPKAAKLGREGFAATLGRMLARRGVIVMSPAALRLLDRISTVVLDADALTSGEVVLGDIIPVGTSDLAELAAAAHTLFTPDAPERPQYDIDFELGPLLEPPNRATSAACTKLRSEGAIDVLGLRRGGRLEAVVGVVAEPAQAADTLAAAARRAGLRLVVASPFAARDAPAAPGVAVADQVVPGGSRLVASVRALQAGGEGVLLISRQRRALAAADLGVGVVSPDGTPAWGAHVLVGDDLSAAALLVEGAGVAASVARRSVTVSRVGTALGAAIAVAGWPAGLSNRTMLAVDGAAAVALASGAWSAVDLARQPVIPPVSHTPWHSMPASTVLRRLNSRPDGLTSREARQRWSAVGDREPSAPTFARAFLAELANPLTPILAGGAALSASIGAVVDAGIIVGVTALSGLLGATQRLITGHAVAGLLARSTSSAKVLRDGRRVTLPASDLVVGDVIVVEPGDVVPADCRILDAHALEVDESSLTGESMPVAKTIDPVIAQDIADRHSMLYESTTVATGRARGIVVATGSATEAGRSMAATRGAAPTGGVEVRLAQITRTTLPIALGSAGAVMLAGMLRGRPARGTVSAGVGLAVASVPEGLPFLVSAAQLAAARRLSGRGALVRNPRTIEALGRVDVLCFDKTGTLTQGHIALHGVSDGRREISLDGLGAGAGGGSRARPGGRTDPGGPRALRRPDRTESAADGGDGQCGRAILAAGLRATPEPGDGEKLAHSTDRAVLRGAESVGVDRALGRPGWRPTNALPFEPTRGYHATFGVVDGQPLLSVKGAPEVVIPCCTTWRGVRLDADGQAALIAETDRLTRRGYRVLAVGERLGSRPRGSDDDGIDDLTFVGFLVFADPVRATAGAAVRDLQGAGVQVVMITGDHPNTAQAIAAELGLLGDEDRVVTGAELDELGDDELDRLLPHVAVVARGTPAHKVRVVQAFQRLGRTVAMTGDGANDAAAIRLADVGVALGRRGTPAARAAADLVVLDDRVETILAAIVEGRAMWGSVRQALGILVGGNLGEIAYTLIGASATGVSPLSARQLLLVNLLTDLAPALAVALRPPRAATARALLAEGPEASLGAALIREVTLRATATTAGATGAWLAARLTGRARRAQTVGLVALVGTQLGQTLLTGGRNPTVLAASLGSAAVLAGVVQTPGLSHFFGCTPLGPVGWTIGCGAAAVATAGGVLLAPVLHRVAPVPQPAARHEPVDVHAR